MRPQSVLDVLGFTNAFRNALPILISSKSIYAFRSKSCDLKSVGCRFTHDSKSLSFVGRANEKLVEYVKLETGDPQNSIDTLSRSLQSRARVRSVWRLHREAHPT